MELPHNLEAEQSVLGAILINQHIHGAEGLHEHFYSEQHQMIYQAMIELADDGQPIDLTTTTSRLLDKDVLGATGGVGYLAQLANSVPSASNQEYYVNIVKEKQLHRELLIRLKDLGNRAWKAEKPAEIMAEMYAISMELSDKSLKSKDFQTSKDVAMETFEAIELKATSKQNNGCTGIPSPLHDLNNMTSGFQNSDLIIVAARPSVGKTTFALDIAKYAAQVKKKYVAVFSFEMSAQQLMTRMFSADQNIDATVLRTGFLNGDEDWLKLTMAASNLAEANLFIDDTATQNVYEVARKCRKLKKQIGLDMVVIDYLQLITGRGRSENRVQEVSEISRVLKRLARELNIPVIALSQLSRDVEKRTDKRPMMSDLRESGSIEQDADIVMFLYRDDYYDKESDKKNIIEIIIAKQRNGPVGTVEAVFLKNFNKFVNYDRSHQVQAPAPLKEDDENKYKIPDKYRR